MKKKSIKILIISILLFLYAYVYNILTIPSNIVLLEGEKLNIKTIVGLSIKNKDNYQTTLTSSNVGEQAATKIGNSSLNLNLFGKLKLKKINVDVIPNTKIIPLGSAIGMKLYTKGVLVVGMSEIESINDTIEKPFENSGIDEGDSIISINNSEVKSTDDVINAVNDSDGNNIKIKYIKNNQILETSIKPVKTKEKYKIGLWVRDAAAGVGTLTFYEPTTNMFMSLGHGIVDIDTGEIVDISKGELVKANIISIIKGKKDSPGEIRGTINNGITIGKIYKNTNLGVYGSIEDKQYISQVNTNEMEVAQRNEIKEGEAKVYCQLDNNSPQEYDIEIEKIYIDNNQNNKSMLIKITDKNLLDKTGGIIQGMSGAPVVQNGKFIGAVTNVLIKDPTQGYAIFGDLLIKQMRDIN